MYKLWFLGESLVNIEPPGGRGTTTTTLNYKLDVKKEKNRWTVCQGEGKSALKKKKKQALE